MILTTLDCLGRVTMHWTEMYEWEPEEGVDPSVYQQLGFLSWQAKNDFLEKLPDYQKTPNGSSAENGLGAFVKLRAVRQFNGSWNAVVRCGITGMEVDNSELEPGYDTPELAMERAYELFLEVVAVAPTMAGNISV